MFSFIIYIFHSNRSNFFKYGCKKKQQGNKNTDKIMDESVNELTIHTESFSLVIEGKNILKKKNTTLDITSHQGTSITGESSSLQFTEECPH